MLASIARHCKQQNICLTSHISKKSQRVPAIAQVEEKKGDWKCDQLHSLFAVERWDARSKEMKGNFAFDFTEEGLLEQAINKSSLLNAVATSDANRHNFL